MLTTASGILIGRKYLICVVERFVSLLARVTRQRVLQEVNRSVRFLRAETLKRATPSPSSPSPSPLVIGGGMSSVSLDSLQSMALLVRNSYMGHVLLLLLVVSFLKFVLAAWRCAAAHQQAYMEGREVSNRLCVVCGRADRIWRRTRRRRARPSTRTRTTAMAWRRSRAAGRTWRTGTRSSRT